jgi:hypothetical protein
MMLTRGIKCAIDFLKFVRRWWDFGDPKRWTWEASQVHTLGSHVSMKHSSQNWEEATKVVL